MYAQHSSLHSQPVRKAHLASNLVYPYSRIQKVHAQFGLGSNQSHDQVRVEAVKVSREDVCSLCWSEKVHVQAELVLVSCPTANWMQNEAKATVERRTLDERVAKVPNLRGADRASQGEHQRGDDDRAKSQN